jgi:hypothetical protein
LVTLGLASACVLPPNHRPARYSTAIADGPRVSTRPAAAGEDDRIGENAGETPHVAGSGGVEEGLEQANSFRRIDGVVPLFGEVLARSTRQLSSVGFAELECFSDVAEWIIECLAEHVNGAFDGGQSFDEEVDRELECLAAFCPHRWVGGCEVALR